MDHIMEVARTELKARFHKVILGAGYSEVAAQGIIERYLDEYMKDIRAFVEMLDRYEAEQRERRDRDA